MYQTDAFCCYLTCTVPLHFSRLYYWSCNYLREAEKHDNSDDFGRCDNDTLNDSDMYRHHHHHSCSAIFDNVMQ
jgi:hypothetical protein